MCDMASELPKQHLLKTNNFFPSFEHGGENIIAPS